MAFVLLKSFFLSKLYLFTLMLGVNFITQTCALHPSRIVSLKYKLFNLSLHGIPHDEHRRILKGSAAMPLHGHVLTKGYYYTDLTLGTPGKKFSVIVDTGSSMTYVPCSTCTKCGKHDDKPYSPPTSQTYRRVTCNSGSCLTSECGESNQCTYSRYYAEQSSSVGVIVSDLVTLPLGSGSPPNRTRISFGCETSESGEIFSQTADGIMGLGRGKTSIVKQLVDGNAIDDSFSLCFGGMSRGEGAMVLGSHPLPKETVFLPFDPQRSSGFYNVKIREIRVKGVSLSVASSIFEAGYGAVIDSGTTFTYLPQDAFGQFYTALFESIKSFSVRTSPPDPHFASDICFASKNESMGNLLKLEDFPQVDFVFSPGAVYKLAPENYLFQHYVHVGAFCLGFFPSQDSGTLLGGIMMRNTLVNYDRKNKRIGLYKVNCQKLSTLLP